MAQTRGRRIPTSFFQPLGSSVGSGATRLRVDEHRRIPTKKREQIVDVARAVFGLSCKHSTHSDVTLPGCSLTLRVRSVFVFKNSLDVIDYVTTSTECHSLSHPEAEGVTEREMSW